MSKLRPPKFGSNGFTLIELMMALTFFSFMMVLISIGVIQIMKIYQAGVSSRRTQQAARLVMEDITREVRGTSTIPVPATTSPSANTLCLLRGNQPIYYERFSDGKFSKKTGAISCSDLTGATETVLVNPVSGNNELRMQAFKLHKIQDATTGRDTSLNITLVVSTGASDLLSGGVCIPGISGSQFCATTQLNNSVTMRGKQDGQI